LKEFRCDNYDNDDDNDDDDDDDNLTIVITGEQTVNFILIN